MSSLLGLDMLLLVTKGRKSGRQRSIPLLYIKDAQNSFLCAASFGGSPSHPDWYWNVHSAKVVTIRVGVKTLKAVPQILKGNERYEAWQKLIAYYPAFANYQTSTEREIPVIRFVETD
ncbi:MAG: nitroreductase family deazaflavin-dependent oxidoreductase [SAR202 cluster bacterium]|nr:MAG: nitroreductase family deazaflavin-dependent oxidoreductase [SAR202 cluster bacterium]